MKNKSYRVSASVYPTNHNKIWPSSGRVPLYKIPSIHLYLNFSVYNKEAQKEEAWEEN
jgi:hypothetical protein